MKDNIAKTRSVKENSQSRQQNLEKNMPDAQKPDKLRLAVKERDLVRWLDGRLLPHSPKEKPFPNIFHTWQPDHGDLQILAENPENRTVRIIDTEVLGSILVEAVSDFTAAGQIYLITFKQAIEIAKRWKNSTKKRIKERPKPVVFKSSPDIAFARLDFDPAPNYSPEQFPVISEMLGRMTNSKAFCAKIGAMLRGDESQRKQVLWLYGDGDSGKSFLLNKVVAKVCGGTAGTSTFSQESMKGAHWKEALVGKALLVSNEATSKFLCSNAFKSLTGDSLHNINPKGKPAFETKIDCHFVFSSNEAPMVPNENPIKSRLIVCKMTKVPDEKRVKESILEARIQSELPYFLAHCLAAYEEFDETGVILADTQDLEESIAEEESELQYVIDQCFEVDPMNDALIITANELIHYLKPHLDPRRGITLQRLRRFLQTEYKIYPVQKRLAGDKGRYYEGISIKPEYKKIRAI